MVRERRAERSGMWRLWPLLVLLVSGGFGEGEDAEDDEGRLIIV